MATHVSLRPSLSSGRLATTQSRALITLDRTVSVELNDAVHHDVTAAPAHALGESTQP